MLKKIIAPKKSIHNENSGMNYGLKG